MSSTQKNRIGKWTKYTLLALPVVIVLLVISTWAAGNSAKLQLAKDHPAPGQLVDVGGYKLHINCEGQGSPTVVMEAGNNDFSLQWSAVQPEIANFTRVCTYDRAGFGWSEASPYPRTVETMVAELHSLLINAGVEGPYVLVGHSFGGIIVRAFAQRYPDQVSGMVLVDSAHEGQAIRVPAMAKAAGQMIGQFHTLSVMENFGLLALSPEQIPDRGLTGEALDQYRSILATTQYFAAAANETESMYANMTTGPVVEPISLKNLPLIVLSRGLPEPLPGMSKLENQQYEMKWQEMQKELVGLSSNSRQVIATKSGHYIQIQQPDLVISSVRAMLAELH
jgi:pimeloyl-ACP methyl ester carboxylesterase